MTRISSQKLQLTANLKSISAKIGNDFPVKLQSKRRIDKEFVRAQIPLLRNNMSPDEIRTLGELQKSIGRLRVVLENGES